MVNNNPTISKEDCVNLYNNENGYDPTWSNKMFKEMTPDELGEYQKYRVLVKRERKSIIKEEKKKPIIKEEETIEIIGKIPVETMVSDEETINDLEELAEEPIIDILDDQPEEYYSKDKEWSNDEKWALLSYTAKKAEEGHLTPEEKEVLDKQRTQDKFIEEYIRNHNIKNQEHMNYAVEHDERFRIFLEKIGRLKEIYKGRHLEEMERKKEEVKKELTKEAEKDKGKKVIKKFKKLKPEKKIISNDIRDAKKELDLSAYRNKKMEAQGFILCLYLRKNGLMDVRYVKMDEVGQIKVDGYVYHERDATYRFGKKNDPVLVIIEGSLVPINKETLKEHLGFESAEAQKLVIKGIEQAEVVKAGGLDDNAKKPFAPNKWVIGVVIVIIIGIYAFMGGFT